MNDDASAFPFANSKKTSILEVPDNQISSEFSPNALLQSETDVLRELRREISDMPHHKISALVHAQRIQPDLVTDEHMLGFLRVENFDVKLAAKRVTSYWENRYKLFGPESFALPMTLNGAMRNHLKDLKIGFLTILPVCDTIGRAVIYCNSSSLDVKQHYNGRDLVRVFWYLVHVAMENPTAVKNGFVILSNAKNSTLHNFDTTSTVGICTSGDRLFPIRWVATHCCHANPVFPLVASIVRSFLSPGQRESFVLHNGPTDRVLETLSKFHLPRDRLPKDLGGDLVIHCNDFIRERSSVEGGHLILLEEGDEDRSSTCSRDRSDQQRLSSAFDEKKVPLLYNVDQQIDLQDSVARQIYLSVGEPSSMIQTSTHNVSPSADFGYKMESQQKTDQPVVDRIRRGIEMNSPSQPFSEPLGSCEGIIPKLPVFDMSCHQIKANAQNDLSMSIPSQKQDPQVSLEGGSVTKNSKVYGEKQKFVAKKSSAVQGSRGRCGDPRMNRAVQAKIDNPHMPLMTALLRGGFVFPALDEPGVKLSAVKDTDNVTVYQRRNQLLRRLRLEKGKNKKV